MVYKNCVDIIHSSNQQPAQSQTNPNGQPKKNWVATLCLCLFLGTIGGHRFYAGKIGTGVLQLVTLGGCGIWTIIDLIMILCQKFTDGYGYVIEN